MCFIVDIIKNNDIIKVFTTNFCVLYMVKVLFMVCAKFHAKIINFLGIMEGIPPFVGRPILKQG